MWQYGLQMPMVYGKRSCRPQRAEQVPLPAGVDPAYRVSAGLQVVYQKRSLFQQANVPCIRSSTEGTHKPTLTCATEQAMSALSRPGSERRS
jgi:hypothetical protein